MLVLLLLLAAPIRLTVEGAEVTIDGFDGGTALPRRGSYTLRSGGQTLKLDRLQNATAIFVHVEDGGIRADVSEPAPKGVALERELKLDELPRYVLRNPTARDYALHLPTLLIAPVRDGGAGEPKVLECVITGKLGAKSGLALGMWDEACFAEEPGQYRAMVFLVAADADREAPVRRIFQASRDFTFDPGRNRRVFVGLRPGRVAPLRQMLIGPGGETACVCDDSRLMPLRFDQEPKPVGDFPPDQYMLEK
jgi:hypothetical protein